jgi:TetR/AcrR family transcriptional regulator, transcriptional repressor for nem operon
VSASERVDQLLDATERRMRAGGYHAVSFRDVAADVGIRSASVHHHFPQKADLGTALVRRYQ